MRQIGAIDRTFLTINLLLLMCIAFVPFPTRLIAEHFHDDGLRAAALTYGVAIGVTSLSFVSFWFYAVRGHRLLAPRRDQKVISGSIAAAFPPGRTALPLLPTLVALWSPKLSVALYRGDRALLHARELDLRRAPSRSRV